MNSDMQHIRIGLTTPHTCSYLPEQQERLAVAIDASLQTPDKFELLLANGFRRSGDVIYQPHCLNCQACEALRIDIPSSTPSKSQKRLLNKAKPTFHWELKPKMDENWFNLYARYINTRHRNGSMFPPNRENFAAFAQCDWLNTRYLHVYDNHQLIAIAITDIMTNSASAFYTFFDPDIPLSLGTLCVLYQIEMCKKQDLQWLYLGYQIDECPAMNYKVRFNAHQRLVNQRWQG
ncbi:arginyltransferase [Vibrio palustris]|uniref:Aspartate/glutamate leucyltransferase n=1 Tax=Vibrio palustris TaxID=1918946 RepID=A0A1R4B305_9VIBR|nr:arginyltransferase [Vibrio palustris]SJL83286.1 arginyl-tRNA-protein transferase [Vibrio palustris]